MFKYREFIAQIKYKEVISSPVYFIPVLLLSIMIIIEGFHIFNHKQNCFNYRKMLLFPDIFLNSVSIRISVIFESHIPIQLKFGR